MTDPIVIVSAVRTPLGAFQGALSTLPVSTLGAVAVKNAVERAQVSPEDIDEVIMGCVLPAGAGQAPARQAALGAGLPQHVGAVTLNKVCGSGLKTVAFAHDSILAGTNNIVVAGGMESMSNAPYLLEKARGGYRLGHGELKDHMFLDGLEDACEGKLMGCYAEDTAGRYAFTREAQDNFALESLEKAKKAIDQNKFRDEIAPISIQKKKEMIDIVDDEIPGTARPDKIPTLRPAFAKDGTVTAANSSSISDGAAAVLVMRESEAKARKLKILAVIKGHTAHAHQPSHFTTAPVGAMQKLAEKTGWDLKKDVDLFEINEAFAIVTMAAIKDLSLDPEKVNVHGGACALGHPIGASGTRVLVTLIHALRQHKKNRGMASLCIGGGEAVAMAVEIPSA